MRFDPPDDLVIRYFLVNITRLLGAEATATAICAIPNMEWVAVVRHSRYELMAAARGSEIEVTRAAAAIAQVPGVMSVESAPMVLHFRAVTPMGLMGAP